MRLIDADLLIKDGWVLERHGVSNHLLSVKSLADVPTIDPVHAAGGCYCRECDSWDEENATGRKKLGNYVAPCSVWSDFENSYTRYTRPNDFCSLGCRREKE